MSKKFLKPFLYIITLILSTATLFGCSFNTNKVIDFEIMDYKKDEYTIDSIYDIDNNLKVFLLYSDGTKKDTQDYSIDVYNSVSMAIDTSKPFTKQGSYTLKVTIPSFTSKILSLEVINPYRTDIKSFTVYLENISTIEGEEVSSFLTSNIKCKFVFNDKSVDVIDYNSFLENKIKSKLLDPNNNEITSKVFETSGVWKLNAKYHNLESSVNIEVIEKIMPTNISFNVSSFDLRPGSSKELSLLYEPTDSNSGLDVIWESNDNNIASVSEGKVTVNPSAEQGKSAIITARLKDNPSIYTEATINVVEISKSAFTLMLYICGSDLESDKSSGGNATSDIKEILSVKNQPDDINIIIETGGAKAWKSTYGISNKYIERWHVDNNQLIKDESLPQANMGDSNTLEDFLSWGLSTYPAEKVGMILWNHGAALEGVCCDENFGGDALTNDECYEAFSNTISEDKLEWIGYDACLMQLQDIAEYNSFFFNYMVGSMEAEYGSGWAYDKWIPSLYSDCSNTSLYLDKAAETFVNQYGNSKYNDQTLSVLDLSYMDDYLTAWNLLADSISDSIETKQQYLNFEKVINKATKFSRDLEMTEFNDGYVYDLFDVSTFLSSIKSDSNYDFLFYFVDDLNEIISRLVISNYYGKYYSKPLGGLTFFYPITDGYYNYYYPSFYGNSISNFTSWIEFSNRY